MNIRFLIPGKCREKYINDGVNEYLKRISKYAKVSLTYLSEESLPDNASDNQIKKALSIEAERALKQIKDDEVLFLVDVHGKKYDSASFAKVMEEKTSIKGNLVFLFGSSYGLDDSLRRRADVTFSLSDFTFTHYMALLLTTEQVYRSMKIMRGETYDK
ncbi:MAG: 23S rRNA (pseudouridine(1915)-N(3))-methyltransferase RlmH [Bacilli bacterium]|nr:23S rRNA (pseudouridine(1915)-N(3))-methyltransferase RlmH [Bacilli bacterium]